MGYPCPEEDEELNGIIFCSGDFRKTLGFDIYDFNPNFQTNNESRNENIFHESVSLILQWL